MKTITIIAAGITGGATAALLISVGELSAIISILLGGLTAGGTLLAIPSKGNKKRPVKAISHHRRLSLPHNHGSVKSDLNILNSLVKQVPQSKVRDNLAEIAQLATELADASHKDPRDMAHLHSFFNHYLPATVQIFTRYIELSHQPEPSPELKHALTKTEQSLEMVESAFKKQLTNLLQNDILDLDVEVSVLEQSLRMDGLVDTQKISEE